MNILEFIFSSFWHFAGTTFLLLVLTQWKPFSVNNQGLTSKQFEKLIKNLKDKKED